VYRDRQAEGVEEMTYSKKLGKPKPLKEIVLEMLTKEPLSIDSVASKLFTPREKVRVAMEKLVAKDLVVHVGKTPGNRYIYQAAQERALPPNTKTDPAAAWMFNKVLR
jgi:predicted ArsR family transcriptional regulator